MTDKEEAKFDRELHKIEKKYSKPKKTKPTGETKMNTKKTVIATVALTLFVIFALAGTFYAGKQYEMNRQANITAEAQALVEQLKLEAK